MRIGIYYPAIPRTHGGSFTFVESIVRAIPQVAAKHTFRVFHQGSEEIPDAESVSFVSLRRYRGARSLAGRPGVIGRLWASLRHRSGLEGLRRAMRGRTDWPNYDKPFNRALLEHEIDLAWFPTPSCQPVQTPYALTVWDLAHRYAPFFPEVSVVEDGEWEKREKLTFGFVNKASIIFTGTEAGRRDIMQYYNVPADRIHVVAFPTPIHASGAAEGTGEDLAKRLGIAEPYLFYPAQFWPHKNHVAILLAMRILEQEHGIRLSAAFAGSDKGNQDYVRRQARDLGLGDRVHFLGFVSDEDLVALYRGAFALAFPTFFGPDNLPPLEAFALRCPVIASKVSGAEEQLRDAALLFDPKNERELAQAVRDLWENPEKRRTLIERGLRVAAQCTPENYIQEASRAFDDFEPIRRCWASGRFPEETQREV